MDTGTKCSCSRSLAVICGVFAGMAVALFLAEDRCLAAGGRVSDTAWTCEVASGAVSSLWVFVTSGMIVAAVFVGIPVYFAVTALGRWWIFSHGKRNV